MFNLGKTYGVGFSKDIRFVTGQYYPAENVYQTDFIDYEKCTEEQQRKIEQRKAKLDKFRAKAYEDKKGEYSKSGYISVPMYETNDMSYAPIPTSHEYPRAAISSTIDVECTLLELAKAGILPEDFKWTEKARVSSKDIAEADREQALTITEVGGVKSFVKKLLDKFKGIGEK